MDKNFSYYADLGGISLSDDGQPVWVHALPLGEYKHPVHGKLSFDTDRIKRFALSVKQRVLGIDPDIDYDHKLDPTQGNKAAGWVKDAEARSNGLWLLVEFTRTARQAIKDKEYRYFSTEYVDEMEDNTGNKFTDVVRGGGLTNRPFMKNLVPINLSELGIEDVNPAKENKMDRKELAKLLGLPEDATEEQITTAIADAKKNEKLDLSKAEVTVGEDGTIKVTHPDAEGTIEHKVEAQQSSEDTADVEKVTEEAIEDLAKTNPVAAAALRETVQAHKQLSEDVKTLAATQRLSEVGTQLSEVGKSNKRVLSPAVQSKLAPLLVRLPKQLSDDIVAALSDITAESGIVQLGEVTSTGTPNNGGSGGTDGATIVKQFTELVDAKRKEDDKLTYSKAVALAAGEDPELFKAYKSAVADGVTLTD